MGIDALDSSYEAEVEIDSDLVIALGERLNSTDARRRLEDKMEELRLQKEMKEFIFEF